MKQQDDCEENIETQPLPVLKINNHKPLDIADLPVIDEQVNEIRGGTGPLTDCNHDPGYKWNHNETIVSDGADELILRDLAVDEQAGDVRGGTEVTPVNNDPGFRWNHNETMAGDLIREEILEDLPVDHQAGGIRGGTAVLPEVNQDPGFKWNHNETIADDEDDEKPLADLPVADQQSVEVSGGPLTFPSQGGGTWIANHNELVLLDMLD